ncbi:MAG: hypothetical protein JW909_07625 [Planctomycetes bacterium]|nr:hypothetical protein [Planctomycetota bacterium]
MAELSEKISSLAARCLASWLPFSETFWWDDPARPDLGCFGTGYNNWGVQTNQKYLGALAVLAADSSLPLPRDFPRERAFDRALRALRYSLASHLTGDHRCSDGTSWGHHWISPLGVERMMHGVDMLMPMLPPADRDAVNRLIADEADYQLGVETVAGLWGDAHRNKPESNIWNGAVCARAALYNPAHLHASSWLEKAHDFFINGISVPADARDASPAAGRTVADRHVGANFFSSYALDHHAYLNVGYMVICLSNVAMLHYAYRLRGQDPPGTLYHHARDLWNFVRRLVFRDGRLIRIGGDTRIRYCYCQDYLAPVLLFAADCFKDEFAAALLLAAVELVRLEQSSNPDGGFLSGRLAHVRDDSLYYYTRLESDRAVVLSMLLAWLKHVDISDSPLDSFEASVAGGWEDLRHGAAFHRSPGRVVSWSWRSAEPPQGLCLPPSDGSMAEWMQNLAGDISAAGASGKRTVLSQSVLSFQGGFLAFGQVLDSGGIDIPEGWHADSAARHHIVFAALPDGRTAVRLERAVLDPRRVFLRRWAGVKLEIPNDIFNGGSRCCRAAGGEFVLPSHRGERQVVTLDSTWVNVDDSIGLVGLYGADTWSILRRGCPVGGYAYGNILTDAFCWGLDLEPRDLAGPAVLFDNACVVLSSVDASLTARLASQSFAERVACDSVDCRAVRVLGADGRSYLLVACFGASTSTPFAAFPEGPWVDIVSGAPAATPPALEPAQAMLFASGET